jgi:hypothetical protein
MHSKSDDLYLPEELREELRKPLGNVYERFGDLLSAIKQLRPPKIISVGDVVTSNFLNSGILPDLSIVDGKVMRDPYTPQKRVRYPHKEVRIRNPAGCIRGELREAIKEAIFGTRTKIYVIGEEDLSVLPCIEHAPTRAVIVYGQPNEGAVLVEVGDEVKGKIANIYERMARPDRKVL